MLPRLAIGLEFFPDQQHLHFRAIAPHRSVAGGQHDSSTVECIPRQSGPACTFHRETEAFFVHLVQAEPIVIFGTLKIGGRFDYESTWGVGYGSH